MSEQCVRILARKMDMSLFPVDDCYCVRTQSQCVLRRRYYRDCVTERQFAVTGLSLDTRINAVRNRLLIVRLVYPLWSSLTL